MISHCLFSPTNDFAWQLLLLHFCISPSYLCSFHFIWQAEKHRQAKRDLPSSGSLPVWSQEPRLTVDLTHEWHVLSYLAITCCLLGFALAESFIGNRVVRTQTKFFDRTVLNCYINHWAKPNPTPPCSPTPWPCYYLHFLIEIFRKDVHSFRWITLLLCVF